MINPLMARHAFAVAFVPLERGELTLWVAILTLAVAILTLLAALIAFRLQRRALAEARKSSAVAEETRSLVDENTDLLTAGNRKTGRIEDAVQAGRADAQESLELQKAAVERTRTTVGLESHCIETTGFVSVNGRTVGTSPVVVEAVEAEYADGSRRRFPFLPVHPVILNPLLPAEVDGGGGYDSIGVVAPDDAIGEHAEREVLGLMIHLVGHEEPQEATRAEVQTFNDAAAKGLTRPFPVARQA